MSICVYVVVPFKLRFSLYMLTGACMCLLFFVDMLSVVVDAPVYMSKCSTVLGEMFVSLCSLLMSLYA